MPHPRIVPVLGRRTGFMARWLDRGYELRDSSTFVGTCRGGEAADRARRLAGKDFELQPAARQHLRKQGALNVISLGSLLGLAGTAELAVDQFIFHDAVSLADARGVGRIALH